MGRITIRQPQAVLQRSKAQQILIDYWMGHSKPSMGGNSWKMLRTVKNRSGKSAWALTYCRP
jgi:hypothetical protein